MAGRSQRQSAGALTQELSRVSLFHVLLCSASASLPRYRVVAPDLRGHGVTTTNDDVDFSKEVRKLGDT